jgi:hypothetical protein
MRFAREYQYPVTLSVHMSKRPSQLRNAINIQYACEGKQLTCVAEAVTSIKVAVENVPGEHLDSTRPCAAARNRSTERAAELVTSYDANLKQGLESCFEVVGGHRTPPISQTTTTGEMLRYSAAYNLFSGVRFTLI